MRFNSFLQTLWQRKGLLFAALAGLGMLFYASLNFYILRSSEPHLFKALDPVPTTQVALILGSKVRADGSLSDVLKDRTLRALELYEAGRVETFLVSGDHGRKGYDEVNAVKDYLLQRGVPGEDIFLDHAGFDTYDSLYRAKHIFQVQSLTVVTQEFHLPRAIYLGRSLGMATYGYTADRQAYLNADRYALRESLARVKAFGNVLLRSRPKYLGDPIPIIGDSRLSWD